MYLSNITYFDIIIVISYFCLMIAIGFWFSTRAKKNMDTYYLGNKKLPWYILGVSDASGMYDIAGSMWMVTNLFIYGVKGLYLVWIWPVFNQVFLMVFMSSWVRRSNSLTGAQWLDTRFSKGKIHDATNILIVVFVILATFGFFAYGFVGIGKFIVTFLPWDLSINIGSTYIESYKIYALIITVLTGLYASKGGLFSVVVTEVIQFVFTIIISLVIGYIAISKVSYSDISNIVPSNWDGFFPQHLSSNWGIPLIGINKKIEANGYNPFTFMIFLMLFKGILNSIAGPVPGYDMQRILATRSPSEASKMSAFVSMVLLIPRFIFVTGITVLAIKFLLPNLNNNGGIDFERVLPLVIDHCIPTGVIGLVLAGLLAAFMSNFSATVNATPAYLVNDIYKRYINQHAVAKHYVKVSYLVSIAMLILGLIAGCYLSSIDKIMQWLFSGLFGGYVASNILKWIWWRFNCYGYFWGMLFGILCSVILPLTFPTIAPLKLFPITLIISLFVCIIISLFSPPDDITLLEDFYQKVRPWGFWSPIKQSLHYKNIEVIASCFYRDMFNCIVGITWQVFLMSFGIYLVLGNTKMLSICALGTIVTSISLYFNWWKKLTD